jgi:hypothetical protein
VISPPPFEFGAVQPTSDELFNPELAVTPVGTPGAVRGVADSIENADGPSPKALVATTENV